MANARSARMGGILLGAMTGAVAQEEGGPRASGIVTMLEPIGDAIADASEDDKRSMSSEALDAYGKRILQSVEGRGPASVGAVPAHASLDPGTVSRQGFATARASPSQTNLSRPAFMPQRTSSRFGADALPARNAAWHGATKGDIYAREFLQELFDRLVGISYERVSGIVSLGLLGRFRSHAARFVDPKEGSAVGDLMAGTGESWRYLLPKIGSSGTLHAIDFSTRMAQKAQQRRREEFGDFDILVIQGDATATSLKPSSLDAVHSSYGVKTLSPTLYAPLAREIGRVLKPEGRFVILEATLPRNLLMRILQVFYMRGIVPWLMKILPGEYGSFLMINKYLHEFQNMDRLLGEFQGQGLSARVIPLYGGIATALVGVKNSRAQRKEVNPAGWRSPGAGGRVTPGSVRASGGGA